MDWIETRQVPGSRGNLPPDWAADQALERCAFGRIGPHGGMCRSQPREGESHRTIKSQRPTVGSPLTPADSS